MTFISLSIMLTLSYHPSVGCSAGAQISPEITRVNRNMQHLASITPRVSTHMQNVYSFSSNVDRKIDGQSDMSRRPAKVSKMCSLYRVIADQIGSDCTIC